MRRVYYLPLPMLHLATSIARPNLVSIGTCFGKFSKSGKFKLGVTALDYLAKYAKYKVSYVRHANGPMGPLALLTIAECFIVGLDQALRGAAVPVRQPRRQSASWKDNRGHA